MAPGKAAISMSVLLGLLPIACSGDAKAPLVATDVVITYPVPGMHMSAGYLSLNNNTNDTINISHVTSPEFAAVEIHESQLVDGVAKMRKISRLSIAAKSTVSLESGGKHLMLIRPNAAIDQVSLNFYSGDTLLLNVTTQLTRGGH